MGFKIILVFTIILISLLFFYLSPFSLIQFTTRSSNYNFSLGGNTDMQYYPNMRFSSSNISYKIFGCTLQKENDMKYAFELMEEITNLKFNSVFFNEDILITCDEKNRYSNGLFIAGEGGPTNITVARNFNVITKGEILLIKDSNCPKPNVAIHELLHVLGFKHSDNPQNIMYNITHCDQTVSEDVSQLINEIYSIPSHSDLILENVSGIIKGRFLEINFSVFNGGLNNAEESNVTISIGNKTISDTGILPLQIGYGRFVSIKNIWVPQTNIIELIVKINSNFEEISKENNKIILEIKK